jgi:hypothetical protein
VRCSVQWVLPRYCRYTTTGLMGSRLYHATRERGIATTRHQRQQLYENLHSVKLHSSGCRWLIMGCAPVVSNILRRWAGYLSEHKRTYCREGEQLNRVNAPRRHKLNTSSSESQDLNHSRPQAFKKIKYILWIEVHSHRYVNT